MPITYDLTDDAGEVTAGIATITIDRQQRRNALDLDALESLDAAVGRALDDGARAVVLTGAGGHFCAGADLTELEDVSFTRRLAQVLDALASAPVTTIAAISGSCMGLGMQLAVACDLRVASDDARFAVPVAKLGLMVDRWTLDRVARFWGEGAARHMVLTGTALTAHDAWRLGFIQERGDLAVALALAARAVPLAPLSQSGSKIGFDLGGVRETTHGPTDADIERYDSAFAAAWASADLQEGQRAFRERRLPHFHGR